MAGIPHPAHVGFSLDGFIVINPAFLCESEQLFYIETVPFLAKCFSVAENTIWG